MQLTGVAAFGAQKPVTPHRQRLLVAANKAMVERQFCKVKPADPERKAEAADHDKCTPSQTNEVKPPKKKPGPKPKTAPEPKTTEAPKAKREKYADTAYNIARKAYFDTFLDLIQDPIMPTLIYTQQLKFIVATYQPIGWSLG